MNLRNRPLPSDPKSRIRKRFFRSVPDQISGAVCNKKFHYKRNLLRHQITLHNYGMPLQRPFKCDRCGKGFAKKQGLQRHKLKNCNSVPNDAQKINPSRLSLSPPTPRKSSSESLRLHVNQRKEDEGGRHNERNACVRHIPGAALPDSTVHDFSTSADSDKSSDKQPSENAELTTENFGEDSKSSELVSRKENIAESSSRLVALSDTITEADSTALPDTEAASVSAVVCDNSFEKFQCDKCQYKSNRKNNLTRHSLTHTKAYTFGCEIWSEEIFFKTKPKQSQVHTWR